MREKAELLVDAHELKNGSIEVVVRVPSSRRVRWTDVAERTEIDQVGRREAVVRAALRALRAALDEMF